jgi:hypothetical protein
MSNLKAVTDENNQKYLKLRDGAPWPRHPYCIPTGDREGVLTDDC